MNHGKNKRKFGRETKQRSALMRGLAVALIEKNRITTTEAKAKSLKVYVEKLINRGKNDNLPTMRYIGAKVGALPAKKIIKEISPKLRERTGGYTRIIKLAPRASDGSPRAIIEIIS